MVSLLTGSTWMPFVTESVRGGGEGWMTPQRFSCHWDSWCTLCRVRRSTLNFHLLFVCLSFPISFLFFSISLFVFPPYIYIHVSPSLRSLFYLRDVFNLYIIKDYSILIKKKNITRNMWSMLFPTPPPHPHLPPLPQNMTFARGTGRQWHLLWV